MEEKNNTLEEKHSAMCEAMLNKDEKDVKIDEIFACKVAISSFHMFAMNKLLKVDTNSDSYKEEMSRNLNKEWLEASPQVRHPAVHQTYEDRFCSFKSFIERIHSKYVLGNHDKDEESIRESGDERLLKIYQEQKAYFMLDRNKAVIQALYDMFMM